MSNQGEEGWYPECMGCGDGNLGSDTYCNECYEKANKSGELKICKDALKQCEGEKKDILKRYRNLQGMYDKLIKKVNTLNQKQTNEVSKK